MLQHVQWNQIYISFAFSGAIHKYRARIRNDTDLQNKVAMNLERWYYNVYNVKTRR